MAAAKMAADEKRVEETLAGGQIEESDSPMSALVVLVMKKVMCRLLEFEQYYSNRHISTALG